MGLCWLVSFRAFSIRQELRAGILSVVAGFGGADLALVTSTGVPQLSAGLPFRVIMG